MTTINNLPPLSTSTTQLVLPVVDESVSPPRTKRIDLPLLINLARGDTGPVGPSGLPGVRGFTGSQGSSSLSTVSSGTKTASSTGTKGDTSYDSNYFYFCIATNTWIRVPITAW